MAALVAREPVDLKLLDELYPSVTIEGYEVLVDALFTTNNRGVRRKLLERLSPTRLNVAPVIIARLDDRALVRAEESAAAAGAADVACRPGSPHRAGRSMRIRGCATTVFRCS